MVAGRRSFALVIVLVATGAVFALAVQGAVSLRAAAIETGAMRDAWRLERAARDGALLALAGLTAGAEQAGDPGAGGEGDASAEGANDQPEPIKPPDIPELPPEIKSLIGNLIGEPQKPEPGDASAPAGRSGRSSRRAESGAYARLAARGLPVDPVPVRIEGRTMRVRFSDGAGLVNVNTAPEEQLTRYFRLCGLPEEQAAEIAQQLIDWRDEDDFVRPRGAERSEHLRRGVVPRNGPLLALEELLYLPSMDAPTFERVRRGLSIESDGRVHAPSASREVLASVPGLTDAVAAKILQLRESRGLTRESLRDALSGFAIEAEAALRLEPSATVRIEVSFEGGPAFEGEAFVSNRAGPRIVSMRPSLAAGPLPGEAR